MLKLYCTRRCLYYTIRVFLCYILSPPPPLLLYLWLYTRLLLPSTDIARESFLSVFPFGSFLPSFALASFGCIYTPTHTHAHTVIMRENILTLLHTARTQQSYSVPLRGGVSMQTNLWFLAIVNYLVRCDLYIHLRARATFLRWECIMMPDARTTRVNGIILRFILTRHWLRYIIIYNFKMYVHLYV